MRLELKESSSRIIITNLQAKTSKVCFIRTEASVHDEPDSTHTSESSEYAARAQLRSSADTSQLCMSGKDFYCTFPGSFHSSNHHPPSTMTDKPDLPEGYLGSQPKFAELGLQCISHPSPEFSIPEANEVVIQLKTPKAVKVTTNLINCRTDQEHSDFVFTQTKDGVLTFVLSFPEYGYYKFQIFALDATDEGKSLPNAYNYLIDVKKALKPVFPFPKQYAQWKNGCFLYSPMVLHANARLANVEFKVYVPGANAVAAVAAGEWVHLTKKGDNWEGVAALDKHRGKNVKITLNANFGADETKYATLLEYVV